MTTETLEAVEVVPAIIPIVELEKINATDAGLAQLRDKALELAAVPVETKQQYDEIHELTMVSVKVRTGALAIAKALAAPHKEKFDAIINEGKRIGEHAKETESIIRPIKEAYEQKQEQLKKEREQAEAARIATRINNLFAIGAVAEGASYNVFGVLIDAIEVKALPDDEWMDLYSSAKTAYETEQQRLADIQAEKEAKAARVAAELKTEQDRQAAVAKQQQEENQRLQAVADQQRKEREEQQRLFTQQQEELQKQIVSIRIDRLTGLGMERAGDFMAHSDRLVASVAAIGKMSSEEFDTACTDFTQSIQKQKEQEEESIRLAKVLDDRKAQLWGIGFEDLSERGTQNPDYFLSDAQILEPDDTAFAEFIQKVVDDQKAKAEQEAQAVIDEENRVKAQQQADTERQARLAPDKKLIEKYFTKVSTLVGPTLKETESITLINQFYRDIDKVVNDYKAYTEAL